MKLHPVDAPEAAYLDRLRARVSADLHALVPDRPPRDLYAPIAYVLEGDGKRVRPVLLLLSAEMFGVSLDEALPAALAVEVFHNFTLVHDDIMDKADERRGRPTVHLRWGIPAAILVGDLMQGMAFDLLAKSDSGSTSALVHRFHRMVERLCEGQTLDMAMADREDVSLEAYLDMIDRKTGALLVACLELGGMLGSAATEHIAELSRLGRHLGRAFQIQDDLLDLTARDGAWGKPVGGDLIEGKKTYLLLLTLSTARGNELAWFRRIVRDQGLHPREVGEARERMERLGVLEQSRATVDDEYGLALRALDRLPEGAPREALEYMIGRMRSRSR